MIPWIDVSRRYFPSCASSASSSVAALASAPMPSRHRPAVIPPASSRTRTDRQAPLLRLRLLPFGVRWSRRTARSNRLRTIPLRRCSQPRHPRQEVGSPVRFLAPRVWRCFSIARFARRRRAGHSWPISFGRRTGSAPAVIATWPGPSKSRRRPWDSLNTLRSFASVRG